MSISKMVQRRLSAFGAISAAITSNKPVLVKEVHTELQRFLKPGESISEAQVELVLDLLLRRHQAKSEEMKSADEAHSIELGEDVASRRELDERTEECYETFIDFKNSIRNNFGEQLLHEMQIQGRTPREYQPLNQQYGNALKWLSNPNTSFPKVSGRFGVKMNKKEVFGILSSENDKLEKSAQEREKEKRESENAMLKKNLLINDYDRTESQTSNIFAAFLELSGMDEQAKRLRPTKRRISSSSQENPSQESTTTQ